MRLRREQAVLLDDVLQSDIARHVYLRADALEREDAEATETYNQRLSTLRAMAEELARLMREMRW